MSCIYPKITSVRKRPGELSLFHVETCHTSLKCKPCMFKIQNKAWDCILNESLWLN